MIKVKNKIILIGLLFLSLILIYSSSGQINDSIENVAVIIDSSEFYDTSYVNDVLNAFEYINETYNIDYDHFILTNYSNVNPSPYKVTYYFNNSATNHTELAKSLISSDKYDMIILIGYELRRGFLDVTEYPDTNFMFYDLSGQTPGYSIQNIPSNLIVISFKENQVGFIAGTLASAIFENFPDKVGIIGTYQGDSRSRQLIGGFQSAILRNYSDTEILISFINDWINDSTAENIGSTFSTNGYGLVFSALQNNNSLGVRKGFSGQSIISVDTNRSYSITKNNTKTLLYMFNEFNRTGFIGGTTVTFGLEDNVFIPTDWGDTEMVNSTMAKLYNEIVVNELPIPNDIVYASNTYGFEGLSLISAFFLYLSANRWILRKKR
ncbi:MAG: BMP family ABC transporter substrate-binding protein [Candidatus Thorarchaeota archaeon]